MSEENRKPAQTTAQQRRPAQKVITGHRRQGRKEVRMLRPKFQDAHAALRVPRKVDPRRVNPWQRPEGRNELRNPRARRLFPVLFWYGRDHDEMRRRVDLPSDLTMALLCWKKLCLPRPGRNTSSGQAWRASGGESLPAQV